MSDKTDYDKVKELFDSFGVDYKEYKIKCGDFGDTFLDISDDGTFDGYSISIVRGFANVYGYSSFYFDFTFDEDKKFKKITIGE